MGLRASNLQPTIHVVEDGAYQYQLVQTDGRCVDFMLTDTSRAGRGFMIGTQAVIDLTKGAWTVSAGDLIPGSPPTSPGSGTEASPSLSPSACGWTLTFTPLVGGGAGP